MNFYKILGVDRDATPEEIKRAFREKAKKYHPDINRENEELFKKIVQAYEVLIDPEKRKSYDKDLLKEKKTNLEDKIGEAIADFLGYTTKPQKGKDIHKKIYITLEEGYLGTVKKISYSRMEKCPYCEGSGVVSNSILKKCKKCKGTGKIKKLFVKLPCIECEGKGFVILNPCEICDGKGRIKAQIEKNISIPAGVKENDVLKLKGGGDAGRYGGESGDLYLKVKFTAGKNVKLKGLDIHRDIYIPKEKAYIGDYIFIQNLRKEKLKVKIPEKTTSPVILKIKNEGYRDIDGNVGDMYLKIIPV
ncbi:DnaJ C-terminal domain-containing protein [Persephonella sp.]